MKIRTSVNAEAVAKRVMSKVLKGELVSIKKEAIAQGYSPSYAKEPTRITRTSSYIKTIEPFVKRLEKLRDKAYIALSDKDLSKETYDTLITSVDKLTKNIQLLNGGATDNVALTVQISEAIAKKNNIDTTITLPTTP